MENPEDTSNAPTIRRRPNADSLKRRRTDRWSLMLQEVAQAPRPPVVHKPDHHSDDEVLSDEDRRRNMTTPTPTTLYPLTIPPPIQIPASPAPESRSDDRMPLSTLRRALAAASSSNPRELFIEDYTVDAQHRSTLHSPLSSPPVPADWGALNSPVSPELEHSRGLKKLRVAWDEMEGDSESGVEEKVDDVGDDELGVGNDQDGLLAKEVEEGDFAFGGQIAEAAEEPSEMFHSLRTVGRKGSHRIPTFDSQVMAFIISLHFHFF
jgi:hypothetical protein